MATGPEPRVSETIGRGGDCGELRTDLSKRDSHYPDPVNWSHVEKWAQCWQIWFFLMEARNLHFCVKCPDFHLLAPFSVLNIPQTKQNVSWLLACNLCVASDIAAVSLDGTWKSPVEARMEGKAQRRKGNMGWSPKTRNVRPAQPSSLLPLQCYWSISSFSAEVQRISHAGLEGPKDRVQIWYKTQPWKRWLSLNTLTWNKR